MKAVNIVTISNIIPLYKGEQEAEKIELVELVENGFNIVVQRGLYKIGDQAVYIQPDFCLSDISLFEAFLRPGGDPKKSMLGSNNRIRAKKFNLHTGNGEVIYSNGILLPYSEVSKFINLKSGFDGSDINELDLLYIDLDKELDIKKYEEPEEKSGGGVKSRGGKEFPSGIYKTDETNIHNGWRFLRFPLTLIGSEKVDGSSVTVGRRNFNDFIGSRKLVKSIYIDKIVGKKNPNFLQKVTIFFNRIGLWNFSPNLLIVEKVLNTDDDFVKNGLPILEKIKKLGYEDILIRGELCGKGLKGSGNKNNPSTKEEPNIKAYGVDFFENGVSVKQPYSTFKKVTSELGIDTCKEVFNRKFSSKEDLLNECKEYFKKNLIEGIVVRTPDTKLSFKVMNDEYDTKK